MTDSPKKESPTESVNAEVTNNDNLDKKDVQNDSNEKETNNDIANSEDSSNVQEKNDNDNDSAVNSIDASNGIDKKSKDNILDLPETQNVDADDENDLDGLDMLLASSQPNPRAPRGLTGKVKIKRNRHHRKIDPIKLDDILTWSDHAPSLLQGKQLPKQEELLYPPNDSINRLISYIPRGDSTILAIDAIVNAANSGLYAGGGICGSIHRAAGPELEDACMEIGGCETGNAVITPGFDLPSKYVIHAVGPVGENEEALKSAYQKTLEFIDGTKVRSVALCCISTGIYGYQIKPATHVALKTVREFLEDEENQKKVDRIIFVVFNLKDCIVYERFLPLYFPLPEGAIKGVEDEYGILEEEEEEEEDKPEMKEPVLKEIDVD